jgi:hypothetical protein
MYDIQEYSSPDSDQAGQSVPIMAYCFRLFSFILLSEKQISWIMES